MKIAYKGSHGSVDVPALGATVKRGEPVDIEDKGLARTLLRQGWAEVKKKESEDSN